MSLSLAIGLSAASSGLPGEPPVPVVPSVLNVSVVGVPHVGNTLTAMALISGFPYPALTYTWRDQDSNVLQSSASSQLSVTGAQLGLDLSVEVSAVNSEGAGSTTSASVGPVIGAAIAPTVLTASGISGDARVGGMLTGMPATFEGTAPIEINYGWHESPNGISDWVAPGNTTTTGPVMVEGMYYMFGTSGRNDAGEVTSYSAAISPAVMTSLSVVATPTGQTTAQLDISGSGVGRDVYWFVSTSATPPAVADLKAGTGAASSGTYVALDVPQAVDGPSGLTPSTTYYVHVVSTIGGQDSDVVTSASFATFVLDTTAPILSSATATALGSTSLSGSVDTDDGNGLISFVVTTTSNSVNAAQIEAGYDHTNSPAIAAYSQAVLDVGTQDIAASIEGLTDGQTYYLHFSQRDDTGNSSVSITSAGVTLANTTPPELSSLEATAEPDDATSATAQFNIDVPATVYVATVLRGAAVPTEAQMESGTHEDLAALLRLVGKKNYACIMVGRFEGAPGHGAKSDPFYIASAGCAEDEKQPTEGWGTLNDRPMICRNKTNARPSSWLLIDRDFVADQPQHLTFKDLDEWRAKMIGAIPALGEAAWVDLPSSSSRLLDAKGAVVFPSPSTHHFVRLKDAADLPRLGSAILSHTILNGLGFRRQWGATASRVWSIYDPSTFSWERLSFDGKPTTEVENTSIAPPQVSIWNATGGVFDSSTVPTPKGEDAKRLRAEHGLSISKSKRGGLVVDAMIDDFSLELDTKITIQQEFGDKAVTLETIWLGLIDKKDPKIRCQAPFRESERWAGLVRLKEDGMPMVYDVGPHLTYNLANTLGPSVEVFIKRAREKHTEIERGDDSKSNKAKLFRRIRAAAQAVGRHVVRDNLDPDSAAEALAKIGAKIIGSSAADCKKRVMKWVGVGEQALKTAELLATGPLMMDDALSDMNDKYGACLVGGKATLVSEEQDGMDSFKPTFTAPNELNIYMANRTALVRTRNGLEPR